MPCMGPAYLALVDGTLVVMSKASRRKWKLYEKVAGELLEKLSTALGLKLVRVDEKKRLPGKSGTKWEIDRVGITSSGEKIVAIECRRYPKRTLNQQAIAAMAYTMRDIGAVSGITVTPNGVQSGGRKVAKFEGIEIFLLDKDATTTDFMLQAMDKLIAGRSGNPSGRGILSAPAVGYLGTAPGPLENKGGSRD